MREKPLRLEEALRIREGDTLRFRNSWDTRTLARLLDYKVILGSEYKITRKERVYLGGRQIILFSVDNKGSYPYYLFSSKNEKANNKAYKLHKN